MTVKFGYKMVPDPSGKFNEPIFFINSNKENIIGTINTKSSFPSDNPENKNEVVITGVSHKNKTPVEIRYSTYLRVFSVKVGEEMISGMVVEYIQKAVHDITIEGIVQQ